ncbi:hypothetical protein ACFFRR_000905 [Megaselia abdita]
MTSETEEFMIAAFTSEARSFLQGLKKFSQNKVASVKLVECFEDIVEEFGKYMDITEIVEKNLDEQVNSFEKQFPKFYSCKLCGITKIGQHASEVEAHRKSSKHLSKLRPKGKSESQDNKENVPKTENSKKSHREERNRARHLERDNKFRQKKEDKEKLQMEKRVKQFLAKPLDKICMDAMAEGKALRNYEKHDKVKKDILRLITPSYPDAKVHFFGSRINGLGSRDSDIDLFLELEKPINECFELSSTGKYIDHLKILMNKESSTWKSLTAIKDAKVPILKARYHPESIECDISVSNPFGVYNTKLINHLLEMQPLCYKMCILMKQVNKFSQIKKERKTFSTYSLILMVIFYMQTEKLLPSIKALQCEHEKDMSTIGPWTVNFLQKSLKDLDLVRAPDDINTVRQYLNKMLKFFLTFDYKKNIISPYLGAVVSTSSFVSNMEHSMPNYFKCLKSGKCESLVFTELSLQDPLILNMNVTKNVKDYKLKEIMDMFTLVSGELTSLENGPALQEAPIPFANGKSVK